MQHHLAKSTEFLDFMASSMARSDALIKPRINISTGECNGGFLRYLILIANYLFCAELVRKKKQTNRIIAKPELCAM